MSGINNAINVHESPRERRWTQVMAIGGCCCCCCASPVVSPSPPTAVVVSCSSWCRLGCEITRKEAAGINTDNKMESELPNKSQTMSMLETQLATAVADQNKIMATIKRSQ